MSSTVPSTSAWAQGHRTRTAGTRSGVSVCLCVGGLLAPLPPPGAAGRAALPRSASRWRCRPARGGCGAAGCGDTRAGGRGGGTRGAGRGSGDLAVRTGCCASCFMQGLSPTPQRPRVG